jgi:hypothetical protein
MDKSVCPGQDYIAFLDPVTGRVTFKGIIRFAVNFVVGWILVVVLIAAGLTIGQLL